MRAVLALAAAVLVVALAAVPASAQVAFSACRTPKEFQCATVPVPLDHSGQTPGSIGLKVARLPQSRSSGILIALSGGPGQSSVSAAPTFQQTLQPALRSYQLVVFDQRGTGDSGVLDCPALQPLPDTVNYTAQDTAECGDVVGPDRRFYRTIDSADDIETLRQALGVDKIALEGTSYGTFVAEQYAARYPDHVDRLILDSVVPPSGVEQFTLSTFAAVNRVLTGLCGEGRCNGITPDPNADTATLNSRLNAAPLSGPGVRAQGQAPADQHRQRRGPVRDAGQRRPQPGAALRLPGLGAVRRPGRPGADPAAARARVGLAAEGQGPLRGAQRGHAVRGHPVPVQGLRPARGAPGPMGAAEAGLDPNAVAPFDLNTVTASSVGRSCILWPQTPTAPAGDPTTLPDVPVLVLSGDQDLRTPNEDAKATAARSRVQLRAGPGQRARRARRRHHRLRATGADPLHRRPHGRRPVRRADQPDRPAAGRAHAPEPGAAGPRHRRHSRRSALAALATVDDMTAVAVIRLFNGANALGYGGLRGGYFTGTFANSTGITTTLHGVVYMPGVSVAAALPASSFDLPPTGTLTVRGGASGSGPACGCRSNGTVTGTIRGKTVKVHAAGRPRRPTGLPFDPAAARAAAAWARVSQR